MEPLFRDLLAVISRKPHISIVGTECFSLLLCEEWVATDRAFGIVSQIDNPLVDATIANNMPAREVEGPLDD